MSSADLKATTFNDLKISQTVIDILKNNEISTPTQIQQSTLKAFSNDLIVQSPTGTGKTLAYSIPIAESYYKNNKNVFAAVIVPTRELAQQVAEVLISLGLKCSVIIGGTESSEELESVIVATPGRFNQILLNSKSVLMNGKKMAQILRNFDFFILDEADKLLSLGFRNQLLMITRHLKSKRNALFSATFNENISSLCRSFLKSPKFIKNTEKIQLDIKYHKTTPFMKILNLFGIFKKYKRVIVFFLTCNEVDYFTELFRAFGYKIVKIHGKMEQKERSNVYSNFDNILFGTDVASRGIDFKGVDIVVHFDIPTIPETFLHRSGRSARNNQKGKALILINKHEEKYLNYLKIKEIKIEEENSLDFDDDKMLEFRKKFESMKNDEVSLESTSTISTKETEPASEEESWFQILNQVMTDDILKLSVKAFVAHIAAYKEHSLKYILDFKEIDFDSLARLHFLVRIPTMKELSAVKFKYFKKNKDQN